MGTYFNPSNKGFRKASRDEIYIDKTGLLNILNRRLGAEKNCVSVSHARRFGKSQAARMIDAYYSRGCDSKELFMGLKISESEDFPKHLNKYNVIHLDISSIADYYKENIVSKIIELIYNELKAEYPDIMDIDNPFATILKQVYDKSEHEFVIIIDEWDCIVREFSQNQEIVHEYLQFLHSLFKSEESQEFLALGYITGILPIKKIRDESALNNFREYTMIDSKEFTPYFGFTEDEVFESMNEYGYTNKDEVKQWYDGFTIGTEHDMYNPWSIINFLDSGKLEPYWSNTSSNSLAGKLIKEGSKEIKSDFQTLIEGGTITKKIDTEMVFSRLSSDEDAVWSLLVSSGYMKPISRNGKKTEITITNYEVRQMFEGLVEEWFGMERSEYNDFIRALLKGNVYEMNKTMNELSLSMFSSFDAGNRPSERLRPERFYHGFVLGLLVELRDRYIVTSNRESGYGRYDVILEPRNPAQNDGIILEFKVHDKEDGENTLEDTVKSALMQIEEMKYEQTLIEHNVPKEKIRKYGFAFEGKKVLIGAS